MSPLYVLLHGQGSSNKEWFVDRPELIRYFKDAGLAHIAPDLYGHGDFTPLERDFNPDYIDDEFFPLYVKRSADAIERLIKDAVDSGTAACVHLISYSAGSVIALELLKRGLPISSVNMAVPNPDYDQADEYALCTNAGLLSGLSVRVYAGQHDEEVPIVDIRRFVASHPPLVYREYECGHLLPSVWADDLIADISV